MEKSPLQVEVEMKELYYVDEVFEIFIKKLSIPIISHYLASLLSVNQQALRKREM